MAIIISPDMQLPIPIVGSEAGPAWANDINNCLGLIDAHDHSPGKGVLISPNGLNINADLTLNNNNAIALRTVRFTPNPTIGASDLDAVFVNGVDLYYVDGNGNQVRLTQSGAVAGTPGSIANLVPPASASYNSSTGTFIFQSAANTAANLDAESIILRNSAANSKGLTLSPPSGMAADYTLVLPALPSVTNFVTLDSSGNFGAAANVDNSTLQFSGNVLSVKDGGITKPKLAALGQQISASSGAFSSDGTGAVPVTNLSVTITTTGRPIFVGLIPDGNITNASSFGVANLSSPNSIIGYAQILNGSTIIAISSVAAGQAFSSLTVAGSFVPVGSVYTIDTPSAGTITYSVNIHADVSSSSVSMLYAKLIAYEL